ncbi:hypothetical protein D3C78_1664200 [compost metagenome]
MHDTAKMRTVFRLDRYNKAVSPNRNQLILKHFGYSRGTDHGIQLFTNTHFPSAKLTANLSKLRTGGIHNLCAVINTTLDRLLQWLLFTQIIT